MNRVWRRFAIWLVVLVLPLQGVAAQAAMRCLTMPAMPTAAMLAELPPCHAQALAEGTMSMADLVDPMATAADAGASTTASPACPHCLAHAALGAGSWPLASAMPALALPTPARATRVELPPVAVAFLTGGPDRPPRIHAP